jgi:hypothetical protein
VSRGINRRLKELEARRLSHGAREDEQGLLTTAEQESLRDLLQAIQERQEVAAAKHPDHPLSYMADKPMRALMNLFTTRILELRRGLPVVPVPQEVIDVCVRDPDAFAGHECEDCGLSVQFKYFDRCPGCGRHTGYAYYHRKNEMPLERLEACIDASRHYPDLAANLKALRDRRLGRDKARRPTREL